MRSSDEVNKEDTMFKRIIGLFVVLAVLSLPGTAFAKEPTVTLLAKGDWTSFTNLVTVRVTDYTMEPGDPPIDLTGRHLAHMAYALNGAVLTDLGNKPANLATGQATWFEADVPMIRKADSQASSHWINFVPYYPGFPPNLFSGARNGRVAFETNKMDLTGGGSKPKNITLERLDFTSRDQLGYQKLAGPTVFYILKGRFFIEAEGSTTTILQTGDYLALPARQNVQISENAALDGQLLRLTIVIAQD
jgi:quercetin dioxygenase-like cupin family protein